MIRKLFSGTSLLFCLFALTACLPEVSFLSRRAEAPPTVTVSRMVETSSASQDEPPLVCKIGRGSAQFGREWYDFRDADFVLKPQEPLNIPIFATRRSGQMTIQAFFDTAGQKIIFCPFLATDPNARIACASLYVLDEDLQEGIKRTFDIPSAIRGGSITCAYGQEKLRPLATPVSGGN